MAPRATARPRRRGRPGPGARRGASSTQPTRPCAIEARSARAGGSSSNPDPRRSSYSQHGAGGPPRRRTAQRDLGSVRRHERSPLSFVNLRRHPRSVVKHRSHRPVSVHGMRALAARARGPAATRWRTKSMMLCFRMFSTALPGPRCRLVLVYPAPPAARPTRSSAILQIRSSPRCRQLPPAPRDAWGRRTAMAGAPPCCRRRPIAAAREDGRNCQAQQGQSDGDDHLLISMGRMISLSSWSRMWQCSTYPGPLVGLNGNLVLAGMGAVPARVLGAYRTAIRAISPGNILMVSFQPPSGVRAPRAGTRRLRTLLLQ